MNKKIEAYVNSLFEGLKSSEALEETKEELILNLSEKYQDLISEGMSADQAYKKVIASIGDVEELVEVQNTGPKVEQKVEVNIIQGKRNPRVYQAIAVALFILCWIPVVLFGVFLDDFAIIGVVIMMVMIAIGVCILIVTKNDSETEVNTTDGTYKTSTSKESVQSVLTKKDRRLLKNLNGFIYSLAAILFFTSMFGKHSFGFVVFIAAYAVTRLLELGLFYNRISQLEKANPEIQVSKYYPELLKIINSVVWTIATVLFFGNFGSFRISWVIFIVAGAVVQLLKTIFDVEDYNEKN